MYTQYGILTRVPATGLCLGLCLCLCLCLCQNCSHDQQTQQSVCRLRQPELHLLAVCLRAGLRLRTTRRRVRQPELHLLALHVRAGVQLRLLSSPLC
jgi:hypothetical protein